MNLRILAAMLGLGLMTGCVNLPEVVEREFDCVDTGQSDHFGKAATCPG